MAAIPSLRHIYQWLSGHCLITASKSTIANVSLIVQAALEGRTHFFAAALHDPDQDDLNQFFNEFVLRYLLPPQARYR